MTTIYLFVAERGSGKTTLANTIFEQDAWCETSQLAADPNLLDRLCKGPENTAILCCPEEVASLRKAIIAKGALCLIWQLTNAFNDTTWPWGHCA